MADGSLSLVERVKPGDYVLTVNSVWRLEPRVVQHVYDNGVKPCIKLITFKGRELICTLNHPIMANRRWLEATSIKVRDLVAVNRADNRHTDLYPITRGEVKDHIIHPITTCTNRGAYNALCEKGHYAEVRLSLHKFLLFRDHMDDYFTHFIYGDVVWDEVKKIVHVGDQRTYDLTVENNHNFFASGILTHNTELAKRKVIVRCMSPHDGSIMPLPCRADIRDPKYFVAAPTRDQAKRIYWSDLKAMVPTWALAGGREKTAISNTDMNIRFKSGAELWVIGMDKPERIEGSPWDGGVLDEYGNMKSRAWPEHVRPALSDRGGWCDFIGVPEGRNHYYELAQYAKKMAQEAEKLGQVPEFDLFHWTSEEILDKSEIASAKLFLDPLTYEQEFLANFCSFQGRAYYAFNERTHCCPLQYNKTLPLIFCFDFNIDPGVAVVCQEQVMPGVLEVGIDKETGREYSRPVIGTGVIGEVYIPQNSNTVAVCNKLGYDWGMHEGEIHIYGDATGGSGGSAQVLGSDWTLTKQVLPKYFNPDNIFYFVPGANPRVRARINAMNARLLSISGVVRMKFDPQRCPNTIKDVEGTRILEGGVDLDKSDKKLTHSSDSLSYYIVRRFPTDQFDNRSLELLW
jgi:hypothetical protein